MQISNAKATTSATQLTGDVTQLVAAIVQIRTDSIHITSSNTGSVKYSKETSTITRTNEIITSTETDSPQPMTARNNMSTTIATTTASNTVKEEIMVDATVTSAFVVQKLARDMDDLFAVIEKQRNKLNITFNQMGTKIGVTNAKETGEVMAAVTHGMERIEKRNKRQIPTRVSLALSGFAEGVTDILGLQNTILIDLFVGLAAGATEAAKSDQVLKNKMEQLKNSLGNDANLAGENAAINDITNNNGKQTKNIITAFTTGVKAMNSKVDDKSVSDVKGSNATAIVIPLFCIVIVIVGIVVFIFWRRRRNQMQLASDAKTRMLMTEKTQDSLCIELTEDTQSETEMTQSESSIKTLKTENMTEKNEVPSGNEPVQEEPRQPSQISDQDKKNQTF